MLRLSATIALWATFAMLEPAALLAGAMGAPEKTIPQGEDPPGADNGEQQIPLLEHKGVIAPPSIGDEGIYTEAPNPEAGHEKEVIPPPTPEEEQGTTESNGDR